MTQRTFAAGLGILFSLCLAAPAARAGQVVTAEDRAWAKEALAGENALSAPAGSNAVGVLYFRNETGQPRLDPLRKGLALMLITDLSSVEGVQVVERARLQALVEELGLGTTGLVEEGTAPRVGKLLGARWLVGGDLLAPTPTRARAESSTLDVAREKASGKASAEGELSEFFQVEKDLLFGVLGTLKVDLTPGQRARLQRPCTTSTAALLSLSRALDASDAARYDEAATHYEAALRQDPGICVADESLRELRTLRLVAPRVRGAELLRDVRDATSLTRELSPAEQVRPEVPAGGVRTDTRTNIEVTFP